MSTPFTISGSLNFPADTSLPADAIAIAASGSFDSEASAVFKLTSSGTKTVDMGTTPSAGAKSVLIKVDAGVGVLPILVSINSGDHPLEIASGGFLLISNPSPASGITSISIAYTAACTVRVWVLS